MTGTIQHKTQGRLATIWMRWILAIGWTVFILVYLLQPPGSPPVEVVAPLAAPDWQREVAFTMGHITGFGLLFALWYAALITRFDPNRTSYLLAFTIAFSVGLIAEYFQSRIPDRDASVYDVMMNLIGMVLTFLLIRYRRKLPSLKISDMP